MSANLEASGNPLKDFAYSTVLVFYIPVAKESLMKFVSVSKPVYGIQGLLHAIRNVQPNKCQLVSSLMEPVNVLMEPFGMLKKVFAKKIVMPLITRCLRGLYLMVLALVKMALSGEESPAR